MDKQKEDFSHLERMVRNSIAVDGVDFRQNNRKILAEYLRDNGAYGDSIEITFGLIDIYKENADPLIRERAHKTEAAIYAKAPFILQPHDITYLWLDAAKETDGSVRAAIQSTMGTIIDKRFDLVTPEIVENIAKTAIMDDTWLAQNQANNNLVLVLEKEESRGRYVSMPTILNQFRRARGHTSPEVKISILTSCLHLAPFAGPEHTNTLAALIVGPAIFDEDPNVCFVGRKTVSGAIGQTPSMIAPIASFMKKSATKDAMKSPHTRANYNRTMEACRSGMAALSRTLFQG